MTLLSNLDLFEPRAPRFKFTVGQYHEMLQSGLIEEGAPYELLDGELIRKDRSAAGEDPMTIGTGHTWAVESLEELKPKLASLGCHIRCQQPVTIPNFNEPEPDGVIARGGREDYLDHHPTAREILCVIEVADSSLNRDRTVKLAIYADAGIPTYIIVNLRDRVAEVYSDPVIGTGLYSSTDPRREPDSVSFPTAREPLVVAVRNLLPPAKSTGHG
jgi:Uma2 family endonuclease